MPARSGKVVIKGLVGLIVLALVVGAGAYIVAGLTGGFGARGWFGAKVDQRATLSLLRSEAMSFLVTRRNVTQLVVHHKESYWWGQWRGVLWATVSWRWGVDLKKIREQDIRRMDNTIVCRLPEPELLDFGVAPGTTGFMSRSTAVPKILDITSGGGQREVLEELLRKQAMQFARDNRMLPSRQEIVRQLNDGAALIKTSFGADIRFE